MCTALVESLKINITAVTPVRYRRQTRLIL